MKRKAKSTLISLKVDDDLLFQMDEYCRNQGIIRTAFIEKAVSEKLHQTSYSHDPNSIKSLKNEGLWYEWMDEYGNWKMPGYDGGFSGSRLEKKSMPKEVIDVYDKYFQMLEVGDNRKVVTCKGVTGIAVCWEFTKIYVDTKGNIHSDIDKYIRETILKMMHQCKVGSVFSDIGDNGISDYRIYWFIPGGHMMNLKYDGIIDARKIMENILERI